jgi:hypothetical protein
MFQTETGRAFFERFWFCSRRWWCRGSGLHSAAIIADAGGKAVAFARCGHQGMVAVELTEPSALRD